LLKQKAPKTNCIKLFFKKVTYFFFTQYCVLCGEKCITDFALCESCQATLPKIKYSCAKCGAELDYDASFKAICGNCIINSPPPVITKVIAACKYQSPIDHFILELKFAQKLLYAKILGSILAEHLQQHYNQSDIKPQIIIPIPLHKTRLRKRGFNQALEIAKIVSKQMEIPIDCFSCIRIRNTDPQTILPPGDRRKNIRRAFTTRCHINYKYVAVIDDVITTGSTIQEFCKMLSKNGVEQIDVWCCAKTHLHR
jgi:ComF family protein